MVFFDMIKNKNNLFFYVYDRFIMLGVGVDMIFVIICGICFDL